MIKVLLKLSLLPHHKLVMELQPTSMMMVLSHIHLVIIVIISCLPTSYTDIFSYTIKDLDDGGSASASVKVLVNCAPNPPLATDDADSNLKIHQLLLIY